MSESAELEWPLGAPRPGEIFADRYRIETVLGQGGMGYVLGARDIADSTRVALKLLLLEHTANPTTVARFLRESRATKEISSVHVARVLDAGTQGTQPYIVMEYLEGADLAGILRRERRLPYQRAIDYVLEACEGLAEAHARGTIHRDLKPANIFVTRRDGADCVKVLDFGISRILESDAVALTTTTAAAGTPLYMSPEQLRSMRDVDARTDLWAIGVVLFELIAGHPPFIGNSVAEIGALVLAGTAPDVRRSVRAVPEGLAAVIARCLRREADERYPSLAELAQALAPFGGANAAKSAKRIAYVLADVPRPRSIEPPPLPPVSEPGVTSLDPSLATTQLDPARTTAGHVTSARSTMGSRQRFVIYTLLVAGSALAGSAGFLMLRGARPRVPLQSDSPAIAPSAVTGALAPASETPTPIASSAPAPSSSRPPMLTIPSAAPSASTGTAAPRRPRPPKPKAPPPSSGEFAPNRFGE